MKVLKSDTTPILHNSPGILFSVSQYLKSSNVFKMNRASGERYDRSPFPKRSKTLIKKASELAQVSNADVYLLLVYRNEAWEYNSSSDPSWPPTGEFLVGIHKISHLAYTKIQQEEHYPKVNRISSDAEPPGHNIDPERLEQLQKYFTRRTELYGSWPSSPTRPK